MMLSSQLYSTKVSPLRFFILTFALSWLVWIPLALSHFGIAFRIPESTSAVVRLLGVLMPAVSAIILSLFSGEKGSVRKMMARLWMWRVGWKWWGAAAFVYPMILVCSALLNNLLSQTKVTPAPQNVPALIVNIFFLLIAVLGEEIGWHGAALPAMLQKYSALVSSLILGCIWGIWHLPFWLLMDTFDQFGVIYLLLNLLFVFPMTFYSTWFFTHTRYSLLLPVVFHLTFNIINTAILPVTLNLLAFGFLILIGWIIAIVLLPKLEPKN